ncbi:DUF1206 domain-containing protein [Aeromicrobium sp. SMF47]|uniref:DUF1206 domain-containing protein n=1 Tax=Aeromicrobium yanjiei TaxID=2662028 RepID=A0A5Q2MM71_9ACTN|nr:MULTISPECIES: DUF1206 domain-containing protein [Aeromicrobium]MRJ75740.1 DUF1206 domain-containing protein [Aeromicrobium yanjiei]MRK00084.1 DUF1206 domain-containing protein [Aeromicrobium sp. S22]QGG43009.1 DUF1206 domain-containing protein [Aeromicrobium yanjiei]
MTMSPGRAGSQAQHSTWLKRGARVGLVAFGVVHLLIAWIALQVAWSGGGNASSGGALKTLADQPLGRTILWVLALGLVALAVWQIATAIWGFQTEDDPKRLWKRGVAGGRAVVYGAVAFSAGKIAVGSGGSSGNDSKQEDVTAQLLSAPAGRVLVAAVCLAILAVAASQVRRGLAEKFTHDLEPAATSGDSGRMVMVLGKVGYVAKGISLGIVGLLFGWAALSYDPDKAGGLDDALKTVRDQPFGPYLLSAVAVGLAAFGLFCFAWAKHAKTR